MTLSRLSSKCAKCPKVNTCNHKRMEMVRFLEPVANDTQEILSENVAVSHKYRQVKIAPNTELDGGEQVMATCKECIHYEVCRALCKSEEELMPCVVFKYRSHFVELPCKVGDTAWIIVRCKNGKDYFYTGIVTGVHVTDRKTIYKLPYKRFNYIVIRFLQTDSLKRINFNEIGKTVFFTKEAAEQALKERENNA